MINNKQRKQYRANLAALNELLVFGEQSLTKGKPLDMRIAQALENTTKTSELPDQVRTIKKWHKDLDMEYDEALRYAGQFRFSPFCEYMFRNEPPAKHQEFLIDHMEAVHNGEILRLAISLPPGAAKANIDNTIIDLPNNKRKRLDAIVVGDHVITHTGESKKVSAVHLHPNEQAYTIETKSGIKVTCSPDHMWMTGRGWVEAQHLKITDKLAIPKSLEISTYYKELFNSCGHSYKRSDANSERVYLKLQPKDIEVVSEKLRRGGLDCYLSRKNKAGCLELCIDPEQHYILIEGNELFKYEETLINNSGKDLNDFMLSGLLIGDGCVTESVKGFSFTQGAEEVFQLYKEIAFEKTGKDNVGQFRTKNNCYVHSVSTKEARKYIDFLDIRGNAYTKKIPDWAYKGDESHIASMIAGLIMTDGTVGFKKPASGRTVGTFQASYASVSEVLVDGFIELCRMLGIKMLKAKCNQVYNGLPYVSYKASTSSREDCSLLFTKCPIIGPKRNRYEEIVEQFNYTGSVDKLKYVNEEIYSVTKTNNCDMRCLTVEDDHSFIANGLVTHNSSYASIRFAAWHLGRRPDDKWLQGAHTQTFAKDRLGKPVRNLMQDTRFRDVFPESGISSSSSAADYFEFTNGSGYYKAVGVGVGISGFRANIAGIDDPIASREDAESATSRRKLHAWFEDDFGTRPMPGSPIYVVACVAGDAPITMADGSWKRMDEICVGDSVVSWGENGVVTEYVKAVIPQGKDRIIEIMAGTHKLRLNENHPILVSKGGENVWIKVKDLSIGDNLINGINNLKVKVTKITDTNKYEEVYDLSVTGSETFMVDGIVTHNTRWHEDDLIGHELSKMKNGNSGYKWEVINIPALAEEDDPLGRKPGEGLWPEVFGTEWYHKQRMQITGRAWNSLYQGKPTDEEGGVLKRESVQRYKKIPEDVIRTDGTMSQKVVRRVTLSVDCAEKATQRSDYTAATVWIETFDKKHYLVHAARIRKEFDDIVRWIEHIAKTWNVDQILVEDRGAGTQYIQIRKEKQGFAPVIAINTKQQSKEFRFDGITPMFAAGEVFLPESGNDWIADVENELFVFPNGKNDDYVDTVSQYLAHSRAGGNTKRGTVKINSGFRR